jgi:lipopolysaccharide/colanic/teichoic acid biosynthesis glycosyltransferase
MEMEAHMRDSLLLQFSDYHSEPWYARATLPRILGPAGYRRAKRCLDLVICIALLPIVIPVLLLCAVAIRLDSAGPVLYARDRTGKGGRRFRMWKLRTMVQNAEELKPKYAHLNEHAWPDFFITNDPRVTRVGRVLRKTSLDELPQIINVIVGDMSLVGPRPTSYKADTYRLWHTGRLEVQPGITGLAQVSGRKELEFDDKLRFDLAYIRHRSFGLDLAILLRTASRVAFGKGAY